MSQGFMALHANENIGRNDPCPCGSGKKCLEQQSAIYSLWAHQQDESDKLTRAMIRYVCDNHEDLALDAWGRISSRQGHSALFVDS
jgi:SEC-C motif